MLMTLSEAYRCRTKQRIVDKRLSGIEWPMPTHRSVHASPRVQDVKPGRVVWVQVEQRREGVVDEHLDHVLHERQA